MPFLQEYVCPDGHRTSHLHMGSRDTVDPTITCCEKLYFYNDGDEVSKTCGLTAEKTMSAPRIKTIVKGNSDFNERERERLTDRANKWSESPQGKQAKVESIERQLKKGHWV